ncbi:protein disulfide-isomerase like 2-1 [Biomphalaria pfeifferi]|uniref:Protein disulfide-isomerase like 2-1 n=1 Tax=Biomphalaria pfeifferi TaxID=112525 RepID=A0AAD8FGK7_BIOPF|nr:protein disulfide-isomerase like 2-1 [Biomphalaria pfeifferi]
MAAVHQKPLEIAIAVVFVLSICFYSSVSLVHEINKGSLKKFLQGKLFVLTFVDSPTCSRCRVLLPFYVQASQIFPHDPEIFFTRTHDKNLMMDWGVTELPALIYHRDGISNYEVMPVDITVDDIMDQIARVLQGNFAGLSRSYTVHLNDKNYDELIVTPKQNVLLLIYSKPKEEKEVIDTFEKVAYAFRKDDAILFATLDAKKYGLLRDQKFKTRETPAVIWMGQNEKSAPKRVSRGYILTKQDFSVYKARLLHVQSKTSPCTK